MSCIYCDTKPGRISSERCAVCLDYPDDNEINEIALNCCQTPSWQYITFCFCETRIQICF